MKRRYPFVVALAVLALAAPAAAADRVELKGTGSKPTVGFTAVIRNGEVIKVKKFKFFDIPLQCDQGVLVVNNNSAPLPQMGVSKNEFGDTFTSTSGQKVKVSGKFSHHGKSAEGNLRITGDFVDQNGAPATNCDSGKVHWEAS
jgi:hypothetical protein